MEPNVIEVTLQEAENGWVVTTRKSGRQVSVAIEANEDAVAARIKNDVAKHKRVKATDEAQPQEIK